MGKHVFIVVSKGIPANYGGYETFLEYLTQGQQDTTIKYHVAALNQAIRYAHRHRIEKTIFYILACRIGPFMRDITRRVHAIGGVVYVNPDGHEWMRAKWSKSVRQYWKYSEGLMVKHADLLICDSKNIEKYIQTTYAQYQPKTTFIAYGADVQRSTLADDDAKVTDWFYKFNIHANEYYLLVGRFVPENNYETMIREFMASKSQKDLVIITNVKHNQFYDALKAKTHFERDQRIKFVGTVYNQDLLSKIRELAYGYLHGYSAGGTNPSLLEALASTKLNLLFDVGFNREVGEDSALYWSKQSGALAKLIEQSDDLSVDEIERFDQASTQRIADAYSWPFIVGEYEKEFLEAN